MTKQDQLRIMKEILEEATSTLLSSQDKWPEDWDSFELRWLLKEYAIYNSADPKRYDNTKRYKNFKNETIVNNII